MVRQRQKVSSRKLPFFIEDVYGTWPRVIEPIIDRKHHQHVRLCCPNGEYVNVPVSKNKHGAYVKS